MNYLNSIGFSIDDSNHNIASGTGLCWVNKYSYSPLNFSPIYNSRMFREGFIFICPTIDSSTICVSINKSQKQITVKGKNSENKYLVLSNFPYTNLDYCIDSDNDKRFNRDSISYKFENGIFTIEFEQVKDNQFELVRNQPIFNNRPTENRQIKTRSECCGYPSAYFPLNNTNFFVSQNGELPFLNLVEVEKLNYPTKSFSTPNLQNLNLPSIPLPPIPPMMKKEIPENSSPLDESSDNGITVTPADDDPHTIVNEDGITLLKKQNFNSENDNLHNETPTVGDE